MSHNFTKKPDFGMAAEDTIPTLIRISLYPSEFMWANLTATERAFLNHYELDYTFPGMVFDKTGKMVGKVVS